MELKIKNCPKCESQEFYILTFGKATYQDIYNFDGTKSRRYSGGEWDWEKIYSKKTKIRCANCHMSLKKYSKTKETSN